MTLRIERISDRGGTRICLAGELRSAHLDDVRAEIGRVAGPVTLDLEEVDIVDLDGIRWLNRCRAQGVKLVNCCPYIRKWMGLEKSENSRS
jgi:anti-anti-sigma regulatory factor